MMQTISLDEFFEDVIVPAVERTRVQEMGPIALGIEDAAKLVGVSRTRMFEAVRRNELCARKAGRCTIIEVEELRRWVKELPTR